MNPTDKEIMGKKEIDKLADRITQRIADESAPDKMTPEEARHFYEDIADWLEGSLAGLEDDEQ